MSQDQQRTRGNAHLAVHPRRRDDAAASFDEDLKKLGIERLRVE